jgi:hypothetical protein
VNNSNYDDVLAQLVSAGLLVDHLVVGRMQRCRTEGDRERRGWYHLHEMRLDNGTELIVGSYGVWQGTNNNATKVDVRKAELSTEQRDAMRKRLAEDRKRADIARQVEADKAAELQREQGRSAIGKIIGVVGIGRAGPQVATGRDEPAVGMREILGYTQVEPDGSVRVNSSGRIGRFNRTGRPLPPVR